MKKLSLCGVDFNALSEEDVYNYPEKFVQVVTVNAEFIVKSQKDAEFKNIINSCCSTIDGQVVYFLLKLKYSNRKFKKISGCDFIYDLCQKAKDENKRVFLLGGYEKSNSLAVVNLRNQYGIEIDGYSPEYKPYPFEKEHNDKILAKIAEFKPAILFVGFGAVKQELWAYENRKFLEDNGVRIAIGIGGTFDYISGNIKRAPRFFQVVGLESLYRLYAEPSKVRINRILMSTKIFYYFLKPSS